MRSQSGGDRKKMLTKIADDLWLDLYEIALIKYEPDMIRLSLRYSPDIFEIDIAYKADLKDAIDEFTRSLCQISN